MGLHRGLIGAQGLAAGAEGGFEAVEIGDGLVGDRLVDQRPEPFGGLQLRGVGRQEDEFDPLRQDEVGARVPASLIEHEHGPVRGVDAFIPRELGQGEREGVGAHGRQEAPPAFPGRRPDEPIDVEPLKAAPDVRRGPLPDRRPDPTPDGKQPEAMLVLRPQRQGRGRMGALDGVELASEPPLTKAAWAAASARTSRGRGRWDEKPRRQR